MKLAQFRLNKPPNTLNFTFPTTIPYIWQLLLSTATMTSLASPQILTSSDYTSYFSPLTHSLYLATVFQRTLSTTYTTTLFLASRASMLSLQLLKQISYASLVLALRIYYTVSMILAELWTRGSRAVEMGWKASEPLRQKLFFEFMVFVLGGGYGLLLIVLWPGWIVVGMLALGFWFIRG